MIRTQESEVELDEAGEQEQRRVQREEQEEGVAQPTISITRRGNGRWSSQVRASETEVGVVEAVERQPAVSVAVVLALGLEPGKGGNWAGSRWMHRMAWNEGHLYMEIDQ